MNRFNGFASRFVSVPAKNKRFEKSFCSKTALQAVLCLCRQKINDLENRSTVKRLSSPFCVCAGKR